MEYIKAVLEALKLNAKDRFIMSIFGCLLLLGIPFERVLHVEWFYKKFTWIIVFMTLFFIATLIGDLFEYKQKEIEKQRAIDEKKAKKLREQLKYKNYVLSLGGRRKAIVHAMYRNEGHRDYLSIHDSDVLDLLGHEVIVPTNKTRIVNHYGMSIEHGEVQELFILAPRVVQIIKESQL